MKFKHLNVPDQWQHYWTKYPEGYTILEALISWVSQVDSMTDNVNEWNSYLDKFVSQFDTELQNTVTIILNDWNNTGFLAELINKYTNERMDKLDQRIDSVDNEIDSLSSTKVDKDGVGQITWANIAQDARLNISSGNTAVVGADSVSTENIVDGSVTPVKTNFMGVETIDPVEITGQFINTSGLIQENQTFSYSDSIMLERGETIVFEATGYENNLAMISEWSEEGVFIKTLSSSIDSTQRTYTHTALKEKEFIRLSWKTEDATKTHKYSDIVTKTRLLENRLNTITELDLPITTGYFINSKGEYRPHDDTYVYSDVLVLFKGEKVSVLGTKNTETLAIFSKCDRKGNILEPLVLSTTNNTQDFSYTAVEGIEYIRLSYYTKGGAYVTVDRKLNSIVSGFNQLEKLESPVNHDYKDLVINAIAIGDSLTEGAYFVGNYDGDDIREDYPYYLSNMTGWNVTEAGRGGATATSWWEIDAPQYDYANYDTAIIWLGTNAGLTNTLEADTTITAGQTYLDYANTHTGNYCKIIEQALEENPNIHIHLVKINNGDGAGVSTTNNVIEQIASKYNLPFIDVSELTYDGSSEMELLHPENHVHFGKVGNIRVARAIYEGIIKHINSNLSSYERVLLN